MSKPAKAASELRLTGTPDDWRRWLCTRHACSSDETRPHLTGVLLERLEPKANSLVSVSTDGHWIAKSEQPFESRQATAGQWRVVLSAVAVKWIASALDDVDVRSIVFVGGGLSDAICIERGEKTMATLSCPAQAENDFPPYRKVMKEVSEQHEGASIFSIDLAKAASAAKVFEDASSKGTAVLVAAPETIGSPISMRRGDTVVMIMPWRHTEAVIGGDSCGEFYSKTARYAWSKA